MLGKIKRSTEQEKTISNFFLRPIFIFSKQTIIMFSFQILKYYSQPFVQKAILETAKGRETVCAMEDRRYMRRPDTILYARDIEEKVKSGATSFHCSVERWSQPMQLSPDMKHEEIEQLRTGWDFILDIDAKGKIEHARIAASIILDFLRDMNVKAGIKFSGSRGFHIGISCNAFPKKIDYKETRTLYPELPRAITCFLRDKISDYLLDELIKEEGGVASLVKSVGGSVSSLSPYMFVDLEKEWGNRHLFRAPYSLNEKKWFASVPIKSIHNFNIEDMKPEKVKEYIPFLDNKDEEASELLVAASDWISKRKKHEKPKEKRKIIIKNRIPEEYFPPCIKNILSGLSDYRKRSVFTLATFLRNMNWSNEEIESLMHEWNERNKPPLRGISNQIKWHLNQTRKLLPANCKSELFYAEICRPDNNCKGLKNPINYPFRIIKKKTHIKIKKKNSNKSVAK